MSCRFVLPSRKPLLHYWKISKLKKIYCNLYESLEEMHDLQIQPWLLKIHENLIEAVSPSSFSLPGTCLLPT